MISTSNLSFEPSASQYDTPCVMAASRHRTLVDCCLCEQVLHWKGVTFSEGLPHRRSSLCFIPAHSNLSNTGRIFICFAFSWEEAAACQALSSGREPDGPAPRSVPLAYNGPVKARQKSSWESIRPSRACRTAAADTSKMPLSSSRRMVTPALRCRFHATHCEAGHCNQMAPSFMARKRA